MKKFRCLKCNYVHEGDEPPMNCPICYASAKEFEEVDENHPLPEPIE